MPVLTKINTNVIADNAVTAAKIPAGAVAADIGVDGITANEIAANAVGLSELTDATGVTEDYHKVPTFATNSARDTAISSPANGMLIYNTSSGAVQQYNGTWSTIAPAPNIDSTSGFLNTDTDGIVTVFGTNFTVSSLVKMFDAATGGSQVGSNATTTFVSATVLKATFGAGSIPAAGTAVYIEVDNVGATNRFATAITVNADPTITHAGASGANSNTTTHLGTYGGVGAGGATDSNTVYYLSMDKGGGTDYEDMANTGRDGSRVSFNSLPYIGSSPFGDGKSAIYFDQSGDWLQIGSGNHADFNFGTGDFTIEFWMRGNTSQFGESAAGIFTTSRTSAGWALQISNNYLYFTTQADVFGSAPTSSNKIMMRAYFDTAYWSNRWFHLAIVRFIDGSGFRHAKMFIDGAQVAYANDTFNTTYGAGWNNSSNQGGLFIGKSYYDQNEKYYGGYIDSFRIVKGTAVYKKEFTTPTARLTEITNTKLLINSNLSSSLPNTTFADTSTTGTTHTITRAGGVQHSTLYNGTENTVIAPFAPWPANGKKFGSNGMFCDGSDDWINIHNIPTATWATAWTFDFWYYFKSIGGLDQTMFAGHDHQLGMFWDTSEATFKLYLGSDGTSWNMVAGRSISQSGQAAGVWNHMAYSWDGSNYRLWRDGIVLDTYASTTALASDGDMRMGVWGYGSNQMYFNGFLDNMRLSSSYRMGDSTDPLYTGGTVSTSTNNFNAGLPSTIYGTSSSKVIPTITFTGATTPALAADEDIEFTDVINTTKAANNQKLTDSGIGLVLANLTGGNKNKATLTGTVASVAGTTHSNMAVKAQVRKTLSENTYNNSTTVTFTGSTTTAGLSPGMPVTGTGISVAGPLVCGLQSSTTVTAVSTTGLVVGMQVNAFTGIPAGATIASIITNTSFVISAAATTTDADAILTFNTIIASVDSPTVITLSNTTTNGAQTDNDLIFEDLTRVTHINGSDTLNEANTMMTIATGTGTVPTAFNARRYMGTGLGRDVSGFGFRPDFLWIKGRTTASGHYAWDTLRNIKYGIGTASWPHSLDPQYVAYSTGHAHWFTNDGFYLLGSSDGSNSVNNKFIAFGWKAGGSPKGELAATGQTAFGTNSDWNGLTAGAGTIHNSATYVLNLTNITQTVSQQTGFSLTLFYGHNSGGTFPHNLGGTPDIIMTKVVAASYSWFLWAPGLSSTSNLRLDLPDGEHTETNRMITSGQTSTVITTGSDAGAGGEPQYYFTLAWKATAGISAFGTYTGSGGAKTVTFANSETFVPRFLMIKNQAGSASWVQYDLMRGFGSSGSNNGKVLYPDSAQVEGGSQVGITVGAGTFAFNTTSAAMNSTDVKYLYMAWA